ncbi:MAG TPA: DUF2155 domain-containing protein [Acidisoma sp.]|uniref:DUF2155 domain-containing protein n=1 Tax=Acidisoma sp. TaxID=1872115 RepID=UPI002B86738F|nr:DUF2155 domain-containing protein [Acidisoma sp.]HTI00885.1 DUF2155 domain-containing protein [Acidisoma sp.]
MRKPSLIGATGAGLLLCAAVVLPLCPAAYAQSQDTGGSTIQGTPLAPPPNTSESKVLGDGAAMTGQKEGQDSSQTPPAPEPPPGTSNPGTPASSDWVQKNHADLILLDKIYGSARKMTATVGTPFQIRFLTITVLACWIRPPNLPPDAAIFVQVTDSHAPSGSPPEFRGWIFQAEPALSGVSDATTDISVTGCN